LRYRHHKYTWTNPYKQSVRHSYEFVGARGGIHFHATLTEGHGVCAGIEVHYRYPQVHMKDDAPSHLDCWLIKGNCWHDGSSLYASDTLWPRIEQHLKAGDHQSVFRILEVEADYRLGYPDQREGQDDSPPDTNG
jgi:hypothetical protein